MGGYGIPEVIIFIYGLVVGSFLNVCIYRIPRGEGFVASRSRCPACGAAIGWRDLVPVLSYLLLKGSCRRCHARISPAYPAVETLNSLCWLCAYRIYGPAPAAVFVAFFLSVLIVVAGIDLGFRLIPDKLNIALAILAVLYILFADAGQVLSHLAGAFAVSLPLYAAAVLSKGGVGGGDIKFMAAAGLFLGWKLILFAMLTGSVAGAAVSLGLMAAGKASGKTAIPFGPFLAFGAALAALWGREIVSWYVLLL